MTGKEKSMTERSVNPFDLPGRAESYWIASTPDAIFPPLSGAVDVDVAVIGGGIVGITTAYFLKQAGLKVGIIEANRILQGVTGHTTAKVTSLHRLIYHPLIQEIGRDLTRQYAEANQTAIEKIASVAQSEAISCDFIRKPAYTYADSDQSLDPVIREVQAAKSLGLPASYVEDVPLPFETSGAVCFQNQAQFHPRKYLCALARKIPGDGSMIFEKTRALNITEGDPCIIKTDLGTMTAKDVVIATHFPFYDKPGMYFARMYQSRSYALGVRMEEPLPDGMFINSEGPSRSLRSQPLDDGELVIVSGDQHKTGHEGDTTIHYRRLEEFIRSHYTVTSIDYRWSTQDIITVDRVPYIGRLTNDSRHLYVATGFRKWGMTNGTAAAMILTDLILGRHNPWVQVFDPSRFKPSASSARSFISQNIDVAGQFVGGYLPKPSKDPCLLAPGQGEILEVAGEKVAVSRDRDGNVRMLDPACRHLGCNVSWNSAEQTWDCPCHGSRYTALGEVINGPTVHGLPEKKPK
jgi:glycine/D-amino acid oxidase-like deaminating enzyme/nitrite reductase/ring-hydroxylating ferredoxin subunit